jgi:hypothetical protein
MALNNLEPLLFLSPPLYAAHQSTRNPTVSLAFSISYSAILERNSWPSISLSPLRQHACLKADHACWEAGGFPFVRAAALPSLSRSTNTDFHT